MTSITSADRELIEAARDAIRRNYDGVHFRFTVGAAVRCGSGRLYTGVNVYSLHGACAEQVAIGAAVTAGERVFTEIVAVQGEDGQVLLPPCGNCRQMLSDYAPDCGVLLHSGGELRKIPARELLPWPYAVED